jgi:transposase
MRAYSDDLRQRVIEAYKAKEGTMDELAARFRVSSSFVCKLWMRYLRTGKFAALPHGGGQGRVLDAGDLRTIKRLVEEKPDRTLAELREELERQRKKRVSDPTMSRALAGLGKTRKKNSTGKRGRYADAET